MENLNPDFLEFITLLDQRSVEYMIVGGYAVGFHGFPRYTGEIDFFVSINEENAPWASACGQPAIRTQDGAREDAECRRSVHVPR